MGIFDESYSSVELSRILGIHRVTVTNWIKAGALKAVQTPGGRYKVTKESLKEFLAERGMPIPPALRLEDKKLVVAVDDEKSVLNVLKKIFAKGEMPFLYDLKVFDNPLEAALFIGDGFEAAQVGQVCVVDRRDDGDARPGQAGQMDDVIEGVTRQLQDRDLVLGREARQRDGQPKAVAQVRRIGENLTAGRQDRGDRTTGIRLAARSGDAHHGRAVLAQHVSGPARERELRIGNHHTGDSAVGRWRLAEHAPRPSVHRIDYIVVPIPALRRDGDEELPRTDAARVVAEGRELRGDRGTRELPTGSSQQIIEVDHGFIPGAGPTIVRGGAEGRAAHSGQYRTRTCDLLLVREAL